MMSGIVSARSKIFILLLALAFVSILLTSLIQRFKNPGLVVNNMTAMQTSQQAEIEGPMQAIGALMRDVANNPSNKEALFKLIESLMAIGEWKGAENFAQKALSLDNPASQDPRALYLLALIHHNNNKNEEAAELLEKLLEKSENPSARYSLAILYLHYLKQPQKGIENLQKGLLDQDAGATLHNAMADELGKAYKLNPNLIPQENTAPEN